MTRSDAHAQFTRIDAAFRAGDLTALRAAVDDPDAIPNGPMPLSIGPRLEYAIYHSPLTFIRTLLKIGADPNPSEHDGFPPLIAALTASRTDPGAQARHDALEVIDLLLAFGSNPNQRGLNDYTPLHLAVEQRNVRAVKLLLSAGADPRLRTRVDDCETPRDLAEKAGVEELTALLGEWEARWAP